jgi:FkbM family methyltransferase
MYPEPSHSPSSNFEVLSKSFCRRYLAAPIGERFVLGRGDYASSIADALPIAGFVDDYTNDQTFLGLPIVASKDLPPAAMVVVASMLRPHTALRSLGNTEAECLDYFAFERYSGLRLKPVTFWQSFRMDYETNRAKYDAVRERLVDEESIHVFDSIIRFRLTSDVSAMTGFKFDLVHQYFEDFLNLEEDGESFIDIGCFDGFTSLEFARRAPGFQHITAFEPSVANYQVVVKNLAQYPRDRVTVHRRGLSDTRGTMSFAAGDGSSSRVTSDGESLIQMERLDDLDINAATFLKMDIEGGEEAALLGAIETIRRFRPRLAISVYHKASDFWRIPEIIDMAGVGYELRMRHYTEGIDETVMFFAPAEGQN